MADSIFWNYLEKLPEQEAAWKEWQNSLSGWHRFNTFYTHYLRVEGRRVKLLNLNCANTIARAGLSKTARPA